MEAKDVIQSGLVKVNGVVEHSVERSLWVVKSLSLMAVSLLSSVNNNKFWQVKQWLLNL